MTREVKTLLKGDSNYPQLLKEISDPPEVLYGEGDLHLLHHPCIAIVGTRHPTAYGLKHAFEFARELSEAGFVIVSGMAYGIDTAAHEGALEAGGKTIAVLGAGLDMAYPQGQQRLRQRIIHSGVLLTEYKEGTPALSEHFPRRNRIISGLSFGVLVVEASTRSGSLITGRLGAEQNREVFALPGSVESAMSRGPNALIQKGAKLVTTVGDILEELPSSSLFAPTKLETETKKDYSELKEVERKILTQMNHLPLSVDEIVRRTSLESGPLLATLLSLELKGLVVQYPGKRFSSTIEL